MVTKPALIAAGLLALGLTATSSATALGSVTATSNGLGSVGASSASSAPRASVKWPNGAVSIISTGTNTVTGTAHVGQIPDAIAVTPDSKLAFVENEISGTITEFSVASAKKVRTIKIGACPDGLAMGRGGKTVYASAHLNCWAVAGAPPAGRGLLPIATKSGRKGRVAPIANPGAIAVAPGGRMAYVADFNTYEQITPVNLVKGSADRPIVIGSYSWGVQQIAFGAHGSVIFVLSGKYPSGGRLTAISPRTRRVRWTLNLGGNPEQMAVTASGKYVYVLDGTSSVMVINTSTRKIIKRIPVNNSYVLVIAPNSRTVYAGSATPDAGGITPISTQTNRAGSQITVTSDADVGNIAITANSKFAYVALAGENDVVPVDLADPSIAYGPIAVGPNPSVLQLTPNGRTLLVVDSHNVVSG